jgi:hypothetical protein
MSLYCYRVFNIEWFKKDTERGLRLPREIHIGLSSRLVLAEGASDADWTREIKDHIERKLGVRPKRFSFQPVPEREGAA